MLKDIWCEEIVQNDGKYNIMISEKAEAKMEEVNATWFMNLPIGLKKNLEALIL